MQEKYAHLLLKANEGERLGINHIRKIVLRDDDPRMAAMERITKLVRKKYDSYFFAGWDIRRKYTKSELDRAEIFNLELTPSFEPTGEECGTVYDESSVCPHCGAGRRQVSDLVLDLRKIPKNRDITSTIADEWIVSQRLAELMLDANLSGFKLRPVKHKARYRDDPIDYRLLPTGRKMLGMARKLGYKELSWKFAVWINHPDQRELMDQIDKEQVERGERRDRRRGKPLPVWHQLIVTGSAGITLPPTTFGIEPFDLGTKRKSRIRLDDNLKPHFAHFRDNDLKGEYRCPLGHVSGLNLLSEVFVARSAWNGRDLAVTDNLVGVPRGLLVPRPMLLISPRFWRLLQQHKFKACRYDVAHLV